MDERDPVDIWQERWANEDFSWNGLANRPSWGGRGETLQTFLRHSKGPSRTDEQLIEQSVLVECGHYGIFHVLFIPIAWTGDEKIVRLDETALRNAQKFVLDDLQDRVLNERFSGTISGVHLSLDAINRLVAGTRASFLLSRFDGEVRGIPKRPNRNFDECLFVEPVSLAERLNETPRPNIQFNKCIFKSEIFVSGIQGVNEIEFRECNIIGKMSINRQCDLNININECKLFTLDSLGLKLEGNLEIYESQITTRLSLCGVEFCKSFSIISSVLNNSIELLDCDFKGRATFSEIDWPDREGSTATATGSKFFSTVSFSGRHAPPSALFCDVEFASNVSFSGWSDRQLRTCFFNELALVVKDDAEWQSNFVQSLEGGCRTLRKLAEVRGDVNQEHFWHRAEIIARRKTRDTALAEKIFSVLYGIFADYGLSIFRPLGCLLVVTLLFTLIYGWIGGSSWFGSVNWNNVEEGFGFSLNRTLPIGVFADDQNAWRKQLLGQGGNIKDIGVRVLATMQSVISAILIYLGVMAVRRKFRIS